MELVSFRVKNYRSINDSGEVRIDRITALLGRNEIGEVIDRLTEKLRSTR